MYNIHLSVWFIFFQVSYSAMMSTHRAETSSNLDSQTSFQSESPDSNQAPVSGSMLLRPKRMTDFHEFIDGNMRDEDVEVGEAAEGPTQAEQSQRKASFHRDKAGFYYCGVCDFKSKYIQNVHSHKKRHFVKGRKHNICRTCNLDFLTRLRLETHQCQVQLGKNSIYKCRLCGMGSRHRNNLVRHLRSHWCNSCRELFPTLKHCTIHTMTCRSPRKQGGGVRKRVTETKSGEMITFDSMNPHTLIEQECVSCAKLFLKAADFTKHVCAPPGQHRKSGTKKPSTGKRRPKRTKLAGWDEELLLYCCDKCEFSCPSPLGLMNHLKLHTDEEPTLLKSPMLQHKRVQYARALEKVRKRPRMAGWNQQTFEYECTMCSFTTPTPIALVNHKKVHRKQTASERPVLSRGNTKQQGTIRKGAPSPSHQSTPATPYEAGYKCGHCDRIFQSHAHLTVHTSKYHLQQREGTPTDVPEEQLRDYSAGNSSRFGLENQNCIDPKELCCSINGCDFSTIDIDVLTSHLRSHRKQAELDLRYPCACEDSGEEPQDLTLSFQAAYQQAYKASTPSASKGRETTHSERETQRNEERENNDGVQEGSGEAIFAGNPYRAATGGPSSQTASESMDAQRNKARYNPGRDSPTEDGRGNCIATHVASYTQEEDIERGSSQEESGHDGSVSDSEGGIMSSRNTQDYAQAAGSETYWSGWSDQEAVNEGQHPGYGKEENMPKQASQVWRATDDRVIPADRDMAKPSRESLIQEEEMEHEAGVRPNQPDENNNIPASIVTGQAEGGEPEDRFNHTYDAQTLPTHSPPEEPGGTNLRHEAFHPVTPMPGPSGESTFRESRSQVVKPDGPPVLTPQNSLDFGTTTQSQVQTTQAKRCGFRRAVQEQYSETNVSLSVALYQDEETEVSTLQDTSFLNTLSNFHRCSLCKVFFQEFRAFYMHLQLHVPDNPSMCSVCRNTYKTGVAFLGHLNNH